MLFYGTHPMNYTMFKPMHRKIEELSHTDIYCCFKTTDDNDYSPYIRLGVSPSRILSVNAARLRIWDVVVLADFSGPEYVLLNKLLYICHGVAAKNVTYRDANGTLRTSDYRYHHSLKEYHVVFFHNDVDYENAKRQGLLRYEDSGEVIGMCCLDEIVKNSVPGKIQALKGKYIPPGFLEKKVILYAPTWDDMASFRRKGKEILQALARADAFIIVKPHPLCIVAEVGDSGQDLVVFLKGMFPRGNYCLVTDTPYEVMPIADAMIADFSSIAFEFTLLKKPLFLFVGDHTLEKVADRNQFDMLRRCCVVFGEHDEITPATFAVTDVDPDRLRPMERVEKTYFANVGHATDVAVKKLMERGLITPRV